MLCPNFERTVYVNSSKHGSPTDMLMDAAMSQEGKNPFTADQILVCKRDGKTLVPYNREKITNAIKGALLASKETEFVDVLADTISNSTEALLKHGNKLTISTPTNIEDIQNTVEFTLMKFGLYETAKRFIIYRQKRADARELSSDNFLSNIEEYLELNAWEIKENSNISYSLQGLNNFVTSQVMAKYWLTRVLTPDMKEAHQTGKLHIHDLNLLSPYTYSADEIVIVRSPDNQVFMISFSELYHMVDNECSYERVTEFGDVDEDILIQIREALIKKLPCKEFLINKENTVYAKYPRDWFIMDKDGWTPILRVIKKAANRDMYYISHQGHDDVVVTDNHPMITDQGEILAQDINTNHTLTSVKCVDTQRFFNKNSIVLKRSISEDKELIRDIHPDLIHTFADGVSINKSAPHPKLIHTHNSQINNYIELNWSLGYTIGYILGHGFIVNWKSPKIVLVDTDLEKLKTVNRGLIQIGCSGILDDHDTYGELQRYSLTISNYLFYYLMRRVFGTKFDEKSKILPKNILQYSLSFIFGCIRGICEKAEVIVTDADVRYKITSNSRKYIQQLKWLCGIIKIPVVGSGKDFVVIIDNLDTLQKQYLLDSVDLFQIEQEEYIYTQNEAHPVASVEKVEKKDLYIYDITTKTSTLLVNGMYNHNCCGWDLKDLLLRGFDGVEGANSSAPAKHFDTALGHIWNFLYTLQGEAAGAQALSNFDTYLAPFIRHDNLTYKEVKQALQKFFHNMTTKTRVGFQCVPDTYTCLTPNGWKYYHELVVGDSIYVIDIKTKELKIDTLQRITSYEYSGEMIRFSGKKINFVTTPNHRTIRRQFSCDKWEIETSQEIHDRYKTVIDVPIITDVDNDVTTFNWKLAGTTTSKVQYTGVVWCPTTNTGTFICKSEDGIPFITGNCPFTNVSIDLQVPDHMQNEAVIIGGEMIDDVYGNYQEEMNIFNKAFCEVMLAGDSKGRQFSFPIPNYNITKDFDWDNPNLEILWKLTGKYGSPYFTNFVNSDLKPEDVRSMCPFHPTERIWIKSNGTWFDMFVSDIHKQSENLVNPKVRHKGKEIPVSGVVQVPAKGFVTIKTILGQTCFEERHLQLVKPIEINLDGSVKFGKSKIVQAKDIKSTDYLPYDARTRNISDVPSSCFIVGDYIWAPVISLCYDRNLDGPNHVKHAYCIEVDSEDHLFEMKPGGLVTHNCRLRLDNRELRKRGGGLFGANPLTGSIGVVTINLPNIAYLHKGDREGFFKELEHRMDMACKILQDKRKFIEFHADSGLYPYSKVYMDQIKARHGEYFFNHFSTIGIIGGDEAARNFLGVSIIDEEGAQFAEDILHFMRNKCVEYQEKTGYNFNLEATPAEGVSYRLAKLDKENCPGIINASSHIDGAEPYYTNSTQVPVDYSRDLIQVCEHQDRFQPLYTGGTVLHIFLGEEIKDPNVVKKLVKKVCEKYHSPYITISPIYSVCKSHGYLPGSQEKCPTCNENTEIYARVVGFYTPIQRWNKGKQQESTQRLSYDLESGELKLYED